MAKRQKYQVEKTSIGLQYVIPGAERITPGATPAMRYPTDGAQLVIPGAEQISTGELLMRKMAEPIRPRTRQRGVAGDGVVWWKKVRPAQGPIDLAELGDCFIPFNFQDH